MYGKGQPRLRREVTCLGTWDVLGVSEWQNWNSSSAPAPRPGLVPLLHAGLFTDQLQFISQSEHEMLLPGFVDTSEYRLCVYSAPGGVQAGGGTVLFSWATANTLAIPIKLP